MKKIEIILLINIIITVLMFNSCEPEPENVKIDYKIINESGFNVKLNFFNIYMKDNVYKDTTFMLEINSEIEYHPPFGGVEDSVYIIFDNSKQIVYRRNDGQIRNILNESSFEYIKIDDSYIIYEYILTDKDYEIAEDIE
ncbi:MAG: hypothetical protein JEY96_19475 [Bacteroidales bacterium]|nr:hypothetical protein [Bacteroidales bacterium]